MHRTPPAAPIQEFQSPTPDTFGPSEARQLRHELDTQADQIARLIEERDAYQAHCAALETELDALHAQLAAATEAAHRERAVADDLRCAAEVLVRAAEAGVPAPPHAVRSASRHLHTLATVAVAVRRASQP